VPTKAEMQPFPTFTVGKFEKPPCTGYREDTSTVAAILVKKNGMQE
jgi:hypothetical protein